MKIVFDNIIFYLQKSGGISVVWYELLKRFAQQELIDYECIEYKNKMKSNIFHDLLKIPISKIIFKNAYFFYLKRYLNLYIPSKTKFVFHSSYYRICNNKNAINITTVHDFTYEYFFRNSIGKKLHCNQKYNAIRKSDYIICISENTKNDLLKFLPDVDEKKIHIIYNGASENYKQLHQSDLNVKIQPFRHNSFVLFVGSREEYKNFELSVRAIAKSGLNLVIVGRPLSNVESNYLKDIIDLTKIYLLTGISNIEMNILYNQAYCLLYPSSYEGFGIPVLEAQKAGCPVIAYNGSSIPEVIGCSPLLLNELTVNAILEKIEIINNFDHRKKIVETGIENAKRFSWNNMYKDVVDLYVKALNG